MVTWNKNISEQRNRENNELYPKRRPGVESADAPSSGFFMFLVCYNTVCCDHMLQRPRCGGVDGEMMTGPLSSQHTAPPPGRVSRYTLEMSDRCLQGIFKCKILPIYSAQFANST